MNKSEFIRQWNRAVGRIKQPQQPESVNVHIATLTQLTERLVEERDRGNYVAMFEQAAYIQSEARDLMLSINMDWDNIVPCAFNPYIFNFSEETDGQGQRD